MVVYVHPPRSLFFRNLNFVAFKLIIPIKLNYAWGHSKSTFARRGGRAVGRLTKSEQKRTGGGGGLSPMRTFAFQKIVWPILFTLLAIVIKLFSSLLHFFFLLVSSCFFSVWWLAFVYTLSIYFFGGRGGGCQNKKISVRTGGGIVQKRTRANKGGGGGGQKSPNLSERTF